MFSHNNLITSKKHLYKYINNNLVNLCEVYKNIFIIYNNFKYFNIMLYNYIKDTKIISFVKKSEFFKQF